MKHNPKRWRKPFHSFISSLYWILCHTAVLLLIADHITQACYMFICLSLHVQTETLTVGINALIYENILHTEFYILHTTLSETYHSIWVENLFPCMHRQTFIIIFKSGIHPRQIKTALCYSTGNHVHYRYYIYYWGFIVISLSDYMSNPNIKPVRGELMCPEREKFKNK